MAAEQPERIGARPAGKHLDGVILRRELPPGTSLTSAQAGDLCRNVLDRLVDLHSVNPADAQLVGLGKGDGYVERQVAGWSERFRRARTWNVPKFEHIMRWLDENQPSDVKACVIHNDFRLDNVVLSPDRSWAEPNAVLGILDWEMATIGDPLMDLGGALAYWTQASEGPIASLLRLQPTHLPGMLTRQEVVEYYGDKMGLPTENWAFYEVFGLFRLAVIAQQIYYRYHHKQTRNPKFRFYWGASHWLHERARRVIRTSNF